MAFSSNITKEDIEDYREAFSLFAPDQQGRISTKELGNLLTALGQTPTNNELTDMINEIDLDGNGYFEF